MCCVYTHGRFVVLGKGYSSPTPKLNNELCATKEYHLHRNML